MKHMNFLVIVKTYLNSRVCKIVDSCRKNNKSPFCKTSNVPLTADSFITWVDSCHCTQSYCSYPCKTVPGRVVNLRKDDAGK